MKRFLVTIVVTAAIMIGGGSIVPALATADATQSAVTQQTDLTVVPVQGPSIPKKLESRIKTTWPWYITRAAGIVAVVLLTLLVLSGIGLITGFTFRFFEPLTAWATHRAIGLAFAIAVLIHIIALLFDTYVPFSIAQVLLPFLSGYRPATLLGIHVGSLYVALGVFAFYGIVVIILTSLFWIDKRPHIWKLFHILSYFVAILIFFHGLYLGTDLTHGIFRTIWIIFGIITAIAIIARLKRIRSV